MPQVIGDKQKWGDVRRFGVVSAAWEADAPAFDGKTIR